MVGLQMVFFSSTYSERIESNRIESEILILYFFLPSQKTCSGVNVYAVCMHMKIQCMQFLRVRWLHEPMQCYWVHHCSVVGLHLIALAQRGRKSELLPKLLAPLLQHRSEEQEMKYVEFTTACLVAASSCKF